ncbi:hypothetical protein JHK87_049853 [Glycine soja]|nr:hypothetical protein JHK87_049853 [Glycine soja]
MSISTCNSHIRQGFHARHWTTLVHTWGLDKLVTHCLTRILPQTLDRLPQRGTIYFNTGQPLSLASQLRAWGAYVLSRNHKIYMASYLALRDICPPSCQRYLFKMTCEVWDPTQPRCQNYMISRNNIVIDWNWQKPDNDPMLSCKFSLTSDGRLQNLFWSNGASRVDYQCFGDIVAFDTTYKNKYNKPLSSIPYQASKEDHELQIADDKGADIGLKRYNLKLKKGNGKSRENSIHEEKRPSNAYNDPRLSALF